MTGGLRAVQVNRLRFRVTGRLIAALAAVVGVPSDHLSSSGHPARLPAGTKAAITPHKYVVHARDLRRRLDAYRSRTFRRRSGDHPAMDGVRSAWWMTTPGAQQLKG